MSARRPSAETIETGGCRILLRRLEGPRARECWLLAQPVGSPGDARAQASAIYRAVGEALSAEGGGFDSIAWERVHLRDVARDLDDVRAARRERMGDGPTGGVRLEIEQPPIDEAHALEVSIHAILPRRAPDDDRAVGGDAQTRTVTTHLDRERRFDVAAIYGTGADAEGEAKALFEEGERLLAASGFSFRDVVRTWIHVRDIGRDYEALNRGRRSFFEARGIDPPPASTGIGGGSASSGHDFVLGLQAVVAEGGLERRVMHAPTLNEAPQYGADFVRGLRVEEANKTVLHVSGTASIDEAGRTAHVDDFDAQADRMLVNVRALLEGQGAGFDDIVSAITYVKRPEDGARLRERLAAAGYDGFPNAIVVATVCRPDLLCETEAVAVLPKAASRA